MPEDAVAWIAPTIAAVLGVVGALGLSLTPFRAWTLLIRRRIWDPLQPVPAHFALAVLALAGIAFAGIVAVDTYPRIYHCLMESRCGPNQSSGMIKMAILGGAVAIQETAWLLAGLGQRYLRRHAI
jgi:hypothetical protein